MFIQIASYTAEKSAREAQFNKDVKAAFKENDLFIYKDDTSSYYKILAGPFERDEIGVELVKFQNFGFSDAFVYRP